MWYRGIAKVTFAMDLDSFVSCHNGFHHDVKMA